MIYWIFHLHAPQNLFSIFLVGAMSFLGFHILMKVHWFPPDFFHGGWVLVWMCKVSAYGLFHGVPLIFRWFEQHRCNNAGNFPITKNNFSLAEKLITNLQGVPDVFPALLVPKADYPNQRWMCNGGANSNICGRYAQPNITVNRKLWSQWSVAVNAFECQHGEPYPTNVTCIISLGKARVIIHVFEDGYCFWIRIDSQDSTGLKHLLFCIGQPEFYCTLTVRTVCRCHFFKNWYVVFFLS